MKNKLKDLSKEELEIYKSNGCTNKEIAEKYKVSLTTLTNRMKLLGISAKQYINDINNKKSKFNINVFDVIDTEEKAYWLGFLYADGNISSKDNGVRLGLSSIDKPHLIKFKSFLNDSRSDSVVHTRKFTTTYSGDIKEESSYAVYNKHFKETLISYGCISNKSLILKFPNIKIFANEELVFDFIRGYWDGDGCLYSDKSTGSFKIELLGTLDFLEHVKNIINERKGSLIKKNNIYRLSYYGKTAERVAMKLYEESTIYLDRKYNKFAALCTLHSEKSDNIGEGCDANTEITSEIAKGPEES